MSLGIDIDADLQATVFSDWGESATYKALASRAFTPADGTSTPTYTSVAVTVVPRPVKVRELDRLRTEGGQILGTVIESKDRAFLVRAAELTAGSVTVVGDGDVITYGGADWRVLASELRGAGAMYFIVVRPD